MMNKPDTIPPKTTEDFGPSIAADGHGNWVAVWQTELPDAAGREVRYMRVHRRCHDMVGSLNAGALSRVSHGFERELPSCRAFATGGNGAWVTVWDAPDNIYAARSADSGNTWSAGVPPGGHDDPRRPWMHIIRASRTDGGQNWVAVWSASSPGTPFNNYYLQCSRSVDGGLTWSPSRNIEVLDNSVDSALNYSAPVASDGAGTWYVAAQVGGRGGWCWRSADNGATWPFPRSRQQCQPRSMGGRKSPPIPAAPVGIAWWDGYNTKHTVRVFG